MVTFSLFLNYAYPGCHIHTVRVFAANRLNQFSIREMSKLHSVLVVLHGKPDEERNYSLRSAWNGWRVIRTTEIPMWKIWILHPCSELTIFWLCSLEVVIRMLSLRESFNDKVIYPEFDWQLVNIQDYKIFRPSIFENQISMSLEKLIWVVGCYISFRVEGLISTIVVLSEVYLRIIFSKALFWFTTII